VNGAPNGDAAARLAQRDRLMHRGPDGAGLYREEGGRVVLGHRRLSIVDLSPTGAQPMAGPEGESVIVFNGEIYNHRELRAQLAASGMAFRGTSDTEVILAAYRAWGERCVDRLNGMFAFAIYDRRSGRLFLARDRAGEKPLFYRHTPGRFAFASELKALLADHESAPRLDLGALELYLAHGYVPGGHCILEGVRKLEAAHILIYDLAADYLEVRRYWALPETEADETADEAELLTELDALLEDAVRRQLVADVPVGVLLSGGVDSSLVTAMAARVSSSPVHTFTIAFPGHGGYDESAYARLVAEHFGTRHTELAAEPASVELLADLARQYDEPIADSSMVPTYLVSRMIREHAKVALGGDGGDELFGGYPHYSWIQRQDRMRRLVPSPLRWAVGRASAALPLGFRGRNYMRGFAADLAWSIAHVNMYFDADARRHLLAREVVARGGVSLRPERLKAEFARGGHTPLQQATRADFRSYLVDDILVKVDRASMLASLEVRAPFLDRRLIEFAFRRIPDRLRATDTERKILLRRIGERLLPPQLDLRRKQGFSLPLKSWFRGEWGDFMIGVLREAPPSLFRPEAIRSLIVGQRRGYSNTQRLFALTMFELWRREYGVALPA
jgi:asparagine synthase (glutamine-hydrolysing)